MMTRDEHLNWCKERAREYARGGDFKNAIASMGSDLRKHEETSHSASMGIQLGLSLLMSGNMRTRKQCIDWIDGFN